LSQTKENKTGQVVSILTMEPEEWQGQDIACRKELMLSKL
jgi:hypothetical protein